MKKENNQPTATLILPSLNKDESVKKGVMLIPCNVKTDATEKYCDMVYYSSCKMSISKLANDLTIAYASYDKLTDKIVQVETLRDSMTKNSENYDGRLAIYNEEIDALKVKRAKVNEKIETIKLTKEKIENVYNIFMNARISELLFCEHFSDVKASGKGSKELNEKSEVLARIESHDNYTVWYDLTKEFVVSELSSSNFVNSLVWMFIKYNGEKLANNSYTYQIEGMAQLYKFMKRYDKESTSELCNVDNLKALNSERREMIELVAHNLNTEDNNVFTKRIVNINFTRCQRISNQFIKMSLNTNKGTVSDKPLDAYGLVQLVYMVAYMVLTGQDDSTLFSANSGETLGSSEFFKQCLR